MDTSGCPSGWATDKAYDSGFPLCDTRLDVYWGVASLFILSKVINVAILLFTRRRQMQGEKIKPPKNGSNTFTERIMRFHLVRLSTEGSMLFLSIILHVAIGTGVANSGNALSWVLYTICYLPFQIGRAFHGKNTLRLNRLILPALLRNSPEALLLGKLDFIGSLMVAFMGAAAVLSQILLVVIAPILVSQEIPLAQVGLCCKGMVVLTHQTFSYHQVSRCSHVLWTYDRELSLGLVPIDDESVLRTRTQIRTALFKLRRAKLTMAFIFVPALFFALSARAIPWRWYVILAPLISDAFSSFMESFFAGQKYSLFAVLSKRFTSGSTANETATAGRSAKVFREDLYLPESPKAKTGNFVLVPMVVSEDVRDKISA